MLDPEFKAKWVEALENDVYPQGLNHLKVNASYCCLGVACLVAGAVFNHDPEDGCYVAVRDGTIISDEDIKLSEDFLKEIGLSEEEQTELSHMNDGHLSEDVPGHVRRHNFKEIAAYIREKL